MKKISKILSIIIIILIIIIVTIFGVKAFSHKPVTQPEPAQKTNVKKQNKAETQETKKQTTSDNNQVHQNNAKNTNNPVTQITNSDQAKVLKYQSDLDGIKAENAAENFYNSLTYNPATKTTEIQLGPGGKADLAATIRSTIERLSHTDGVVNNQTIILDQQGQPIE